jgi:hypothetical protein
VTGLPYRYTDSGGDELEITRVGGASGAVLWAPARVLVDRADVPRVAREIAEAMHEAAGLASPAVLERPSLPQGASHLILSPGTVGPGTRPGRVHLECPAALTAGEARRIAAALALFAERAEAEEAGAEALAAAIRGARTAEDAARAILTRYTLTERDGSHG